MNQYLKFLDIDQPFEQTPARFSTVALVLKAARKLAGRNITTGIYEKGEYNDENFDEGLLYPFQFLAIISYLVFLEQIGRLFINKEKPELIEKNEIAFALKSFSAFYDEEKINAIRGLRNGLVHKFSQTTEMKTEKMYKFHLSVEKNEEVVKLSNVPYEKFSDKSDDSATNIFIYDLFDLIENIFENVKKGIAEGTIDCKVEKDELFSRFSITF